MKLLTLTSLVFLCCSTSVFAAIGSNEAAAKFARQNQQWRQAVIDFTNADADKVVVPYLEFVALGKNYRGSDWCRGDIVDIVKQALALNASSMLAHSMLYRCATKRRDKKARQLHRETITGLMKIVVNGKTADSIDQAIEIRELEEARLILQAMEYEQLDMELVESNGGLYYYVHVIDPTTGKSAGKYFTNLAFMKRQFKLSDNDKVIKQALRTFGQTRVALLKKYQAKTLIAQKRYDDARDLLGSIHTDSMVKNVMLGTIYLDTNQHQQFQQISKALVWDAKAGFIPAQQLLERYKTGQSKH